MPLVRLDGRSVIEVAGPDAEHLLQNIVTTDLAALPEGVAKPGALLTPQGKILFDFLVWRTGPESFALECRADVADDFARRLTMYKLRAKADITKRDQGVAAVSWRDDSVGSGSDSTSSGTASASSSIDSTGAAPVPDTRFPDALDVRRLWGGFSGDGGGADEWTRLRIRHGVAESGTDYELGDAFPHDVLLDQNGGVGFRKGCFVGQEVVSRMQHRGTARRRILIVEADSDLPPTGTPVLIEGRPVGSLGTVLGQEGLALVRIDKVKDAMDAGQSIIASDVALRLSIPPGMSFSFPQTPSGEDA
ncbi:folate-binding protein YgfZ [Aquibium sp. LZ166]|uniref:Folate-binding protein YgfZ n=1 Tax=Aquibium pacificus TaxID=3153579 RepID=A0ABV3SR33_9HYPH